MELDKAALDRHITGNYGEDQYPMCGAEAPDGVGVEASHWEEPHICGRSTYHAGMHQCEDCGEEWV